MAVPNIGSRVEQPGEYFRLRIDPRNIGTLVAVAVNTRQRQVVQLVCTAMLSSNDVIGLKGCRMRGRMQLAVFAAIRRAMTYEPDGFRVHFYFCACKDCLALDCITASKLLTWI